MKTMKKWGFYAAALLTLAALVIGCSMEPPRGGYTPPAGMGAFLPKFNEIIGDNETVGRSILPGETINSFNWFSLSFTAITPGTGVTPTINPIIRTYGTRNDPVDLVPGEYDVQVVARKTAGDLDAAVWSSDPTNHLEIKAGIADPYPITLRPYDPNTVAGTGNGTFAWEINNLITGITTATMTINELGGAPASGITGNPFDLLGGTVPNVWTNTAGVAVPSGYYYVDIELTVGTGSTAIMKDFRHVLHIYQGLTSTFKYEFTDNHMGVVGVVMFMPGIGYGVPKDNPPIYAPATTTAGNPTLRGDGSLLNPYILSTTNKIFPKDLSIGVSSATPYTSVNHFNGKSLFGTGNTITIDTTAVGSSFNAPGKYTVKAIGSIIIVGPPSVTVPYDGKEIFIDVINVPDPLPEMTLNTSGSSYNPEGLSVSSYGGNAAGEIVIALSGNVAGGLQTPEMVTMYNPANFDSAKAAQGFSYVTLKGLYDDNGDFPLTIKIISQGLDIYTSVFTTLPGTNPHVTTGGTYIGGNLWRQLEYSGRPAIFDDELTFLLCNCAGTNTITVEVTQGVAATTYVIDWTAVTINP